MQERGREGQGVIGDALRSIDDWMRKNDNNTQLHFVVRASDTTNSSGNFFLDGKAIGHTLHFAIGEQVLARGVGTEFYTLHLDMWALSMTLPHAAGIPVVELNSGNRSYTLSTSDNTLLDVWYARGLKLTHPDSEHYIG